ncbi:hypothetical protein KBY85_10715 [Cyanobium sp. BA5m-10]|uniref:hypothetical protein n=1 Tax=Cyanobium sp. BA5m-10 TaxID=2823705 RepID=UPI0020CBD989|nr:hypothetical protein [Cyanobium sp. BA5m-10]MCP9904601.1 hypothetical protein [Cyanobium sp. BA5m-10]
MCQWPGRQWGRRGALLLAPPGLPGEGALVGAIKPEVPADPHGALGLHGAGVIRTTTTREALTAAHLGGQ